MSPVENSNDDTKSFDELFKEFKEQGTDRIDGQPDSSAMNMMVESQHSFDSVMDTAARRYGLSAEKIDNSVPIGTMVEEEKYKDRTVEEYRKKQIDGLDKATKEFLAGKNIKIEDLYNNPNIPVENLNGMSLAIQKWKDNPAGFDKKFKNLQQASTKNYSDVFSRIEGKLGTDFRKNNPDLFEVGFVGLGMIKDKDYTEAGLKKMVEEASAGKNVTATEQYYIVKALMNAHGVDRTEPKPEPKPVVTAAPVVASYGDSLDVNYGSSLAEGGGSNTKSTEKKEKKKDEKVVVAASATVGKSSDANENKGKIYDAKTNQYLTADEWGVKYGTFDNLTSEQMAEKYGTMEATFYDPKTKKYLTKNEWATQYGTIGPNNNKTVSGQ